MKCKAELHRREGRVDPQGNRDQTETNLLWLRWPRVHAPLQLRGEEVAHEEA